MCATGRARVKPGGQLRPPPSLSRNTPEPFGRLRAGSAEVPPCRGKGIIPPRGAACPVAYNSGMRHRPWFWLAGPAVVLFAVLTPYILAGRGQPPGFVFSGFLINPVDGFSYLAKMRQGAGGAWLFHLPYAAEPGSGAFLFLFYLALGHLQSLLQLSAGVAYHSARLLGAAAMLAAAYVFFRTFVPSTVAQRWAFALATFGSGAGWLGLMLGRLAIDLWVPEAIPFLAAFANAHFPVAAASMLVGMTAIAAPTARRTRRLVWAGLAALVLVLVQPFAVLTVVVVAAAWFIWSRASPAHESSRTGSWTEHALALGVFVLVAAPWVLYDLWVTRTQPVLAAWSAQNITPTPPAFDVVLGFGLVLALALIGLWTSKAGATSAGRLLVTWLVLGLLLVFAPVALQRRMLLGVFFPMAALAGLALEALTRSRVPGRRWLPYLLFALCLPTNVVVLAATLSGALRQEPELVLTESERRSYLWAEHGLPAGALVLAGEVSGNRLPAFAPLRVIYGHPFETPDAGAELDWVNAIYRSDLPSPEVLHQLQDRSIDFVYLGPRERAIANPTWLMGLTPVYADADVMIYRIAPP